ncbi:MAG: FHA domain-containing protein [Sandaracinaceae bacterium]
MDLARAAPVSELHRRLGAPLGLLVGPAFEARTEKRAITRHATPAAVGLSAADFLDHVVHTLPARPDITIGRAAECEVVLQHETISLRHARLRVRGPQMWVEDLGSRNGTLIRGAIVLPRSPVQVSFGQLVQVGALVFKLYEVSQLYQTIRRVVPERSGRG